jgi:hypothetical protein
LQRSVFVEREVRRKTGDQISEVSSRLLAGEVVVQGLHQDLWLPDERL